MQRNDVTMMSHHTLPPPKSSNGIPEKVRKCHGVVKECILFTCRMHRCVRSYDDHQHTHKKELQETYKRKLDTQTSLLKEVC